MIQLTNSKALLSSRTVPSTVGGHNADSVVHIVLSSHSDGGRCDDSSRELGWRSDGDCVGEVISVTIVSRRVPLHSHTNCIN